MIDAAEAMGTGGPDSQQEQKPASKPIDERLQ